ncbi:TolC family protein [Shewanella seohaensis]|uniref:TolC family protein n=1 Tax=Shewanella seohaensis TaxID=755175 RepID=UPI0035B9ED76
MVNRLTLSGSQSTATQPWIQSISLGFRLRVKPLYLGLVTAFSVAGCAMGPDYERPELTLPSQYQAQILSQTSAEQGSLKEVSALSWRHFYQDPVLISLIEHALNNLKRAQEAIKAQRELVQSSSAYARLARLRYQNGVATSLDLMDAQRQLFSAQLAYSEILRDKQLAKIALYRALGGGAVSE